MNKLQIIWYVILAVGCGYFVIEFFVWLSGRKKIYPVDLTEKQRAEWLHIKRGK